MQHEGYKVWKSLRLYAQEYEKMFHRVNTIRRSSDCLGYGMFH